MAEAGLGIGGARDRRPSGEAVFVRGSSFALFSVLYARHIRVRVHEIVPARVCDRSE